MEDYIKLSIEELKQYRELKISVINLAERIKMIESQKTSIRSSSADSVCVQGGGGDHLMDELIVKADELKKLLAINQARIKIIEKGLAGLDNIEKELIDKFYIERIGYSSAIEYFIEKYHYSNVQICRKKKAALLKYTHLQYGSFNQAFK